MRIYFTVLIIVLTKMFLSTSAEHPKSIPCIRNVLIKQHVTAM